MAGNFILFLAFISGQTGWNEGDDALHLSKKVIYTIEAVIRRYVGFKCLKNHIFTLELQSNEESFPTQIQNTVPHSVLDMCFWTIYVHCRNQGK